MWYCTHSLGLPVGVEIFILSTDVFLVKVISIEQMNARQMAWSPQAAVLFPTPEYKLGQFPDYSYKYAQHSLEVGF